MYSHVNIIGKMAMNHLWCFSIILKQNHRFEMPNALELLSDLSSTVNWISSNTNAKDFDNDEMVILSDLSDLSDLLFDLPCWFPDSRAGGAKQSTKSTTKSTTPPGSDGVPTTTSQSTGRNVGRFLSNMVYGHFNRENGDEP